MKLTTRAECEEVTRRIEAGESYRQIARDFSMSISGVMRFARKVGVRRYGMKKLTVTESSKVSQVDVPEGFRRLASGKVVPYTSPEDWKAEPPGTCKTEVTEVVYRAFSNVRDK